MSLWKGCGAAALASGVALGAQMTVFASLPSAPSAGLAWCVGVAAATGLLWALRPAAEPAPSSIELLMSEKPAPAEPELAAEVAVAIADERRSSGLLLANMSHEIWTPINGVLGMARMLMTTELTPEQRTFAQSVMGSADKLAATITDLVDHSKLEAGVLDCALAPFDLRDTVDAQIKAHLSRARRKDLQLTYRVEFLLPEFLVGSAPRIGQCLSYLLDNAVKFTERGEVSLTVSGDQGEGEATWVRFSVSDTGPGVPADQADLVFEPYHQVDASTTRRHEGTGLGLTITRQLVELMGGRTWLDSRLGRGSTFHFSLPLAVHEGSVEGLAEAVATRVSRQSVLLAGADAALLGQVGEMLRHWGIKPALVASLEEASEALGRQSYDTVILDADLPGDEVALYHKASSSRLISLVGQELRDDSLPYHRKFGVQLLGKPVSQSELWNALLPASESSEAAPEQQRGIPPLRVLLVEDNVVNQNLARMMLKSYGHDVKVAANGEEALSMFEVFPFDLVLMDVQMPVMDGLQATREIRLLEGSAGGDRTPILALTAHALKGDRERCLESGMDGYLTKPLNETQLWATVSTTVSPQVFQERWKEIERSRAVEAGVPYRAPLAAGASSAGGVSGSGASGSGARFDREALLGRVGRREENLRKIVELYLSSGPAQLEKLRTSLHGAEFAQAAREAHTLKGTLLSLAAEPAAELAVRLEAMLAESAPVGECVSALARLEVELDELATELQRELTPVPV